MNRDEAVKTVRDKTDNRNDYCENFVDSLVALGLLKLDTPEMIHQQGAEFISSMLNIWYKSDDTTRFIKEDLALAGFQIVRAK